MPKNKSLMLHLMYSEHLLEHLYKNYSYLLLLMNIFQLDKNYNCLLLLLNIFQLDKLNKLRRNRLNTFLHYKSYSFRYSNLDLQHKIMYPFLF